MSKDEALPARYITEISTAVAVFVVPTGPTHPLIASAPSAPQMGLQVNVVKVIVALDNEGTGWEYGDGKWVRLPDLPQD